MKKTLNQFFFTCFCCMYLILLLFYSKECINLASNGLLIWYRNMIPSLFPFMVLSGFMIRTGLSSKIGQWLQPFLGIFFRLPSQMLYVIFMGFLCGFPMGAKMVSDMLENGQINLKEGEYLLAFCNNIGPLYMLGYVIPLFGYKDIAKILGLMYFVPLVYGLFLRYLSSISFADTYIPTLSICSYTRDSNTSPNYLSCFQQSLSSAIEQITLLGGCMVFFNSLLIFPKIAGTYLTQTLFTPQYSSLLSGILYSLIEIGGGLKQLALISAETGTVAFPIFLSLSLLTFGGLSCIAQTCFILKNTGLRIRTYLKHKLIQSCIFIILMFI